MIGPHSPCVRLSLVSLLALSLLVVAAPLGATTMLTNGHPIFVNIPAIEEELTLIAGVNGFNIMVPPGASSLVVEFVTSTTEDFELAVEFGQDVGTVDLGNNLADFRTRTNPLGVARIQIDALTHPRLQSGTYFIGFFFPRPSGSPVQGLLTATIDGRDVDPVRTLSESTFDADLEGWTRNDAASSLPGTSVGDRNSSIQWAGTGGNPDGYARIRDTIGPGEEWFVAPPEFLVDYLALTDPRFVFDIARITGLSTTDFLVELRVFSDEGAWRWIGDSPPQVNAGWKSFSVTIQEAGWIPFEGTFAGFDGVFSSPKRLEVRATYHSSGGTVGLDNFKLLARGDLPVPIVLPSISSFSAGMDGWARNYPADEKIDAATVGDKESQLIWNEFEGNPEGFVRIVESGGGAPDAFVVPGVYLGDWRQLDTPRIEFDYRHRSTSGANRPVEIAIIGPGAVFRWTGVLPGDVWSHQTASVIASEWMRVSGDATFDETLANVLRVEISADHAQGAELNSIDNFSLLTADTPPAVQSLTVSPASISFSGVATAVNPEPITLNITAANGELRWEASVEGPMADRVSLSDESGDTPSEVTVSFDTQGAEAGIREAAQITFTAVGATVAQVVVPVTLILSEQPNPTPVISSGGVVNSATYQARLAPGTLGTIFGRSLGGTERGTVASFVGRTRDSLPTQINGVRVLIFNSDGLLIGEAPIIYLGDSQINFQMLFEVAGLAVVQVVVDNAGALSASQRVQITRSAPGIFTFGQNRAVATNGDGTLNTTDNPVGRRQVLTVYMTGQGPVAPALASGKAATTNPLVLAPLEAAAFIAGHEAVIDFLGMAPGLVGVLQLNMRPSHFTPSGDQPLIVNIGGHDSNVATISIR